jgi:L-fuculose-phosphate aldolase
MTRAALREQLVETARAMNERGLNQGTAGNLSARVPDGMLITPSAVPYDVMTPADIVRIDLQGRVLEPGPRPPSTEWRLHAAILAARPDVDAILHAHAMFATTLACLRRPIPAFHYMVAVAGGDSVPCAPYAAFGSPELAGHAARALAGRDACLLANHGMVAVGASPRDALELAIEVETLAAQYWRALQVGEPVLLSEAEMAEVVEGFRRYRGAR